MFNNSKLKAELSQLREQLLVRDEQLKSYSEKLATCDQQYALQVAAREQELAQQFQLRMAEINAQHAKEMEAVQLELKLLIERIFHRKSERYIEHPEQLQLDLQCDDPGINEQVADAVEGLQLAVEEIIVAEEPIDAKPKRQPKDKTRGSQRFPGHLERRIVDVDLSEDQKAGLTPIGFDVAEKLVITPPKFHVIETRYHKYIVPGDKAAGVQSPSRPEQTLLKGDPYDTSIAAEIITNRFGYHLPFYRLQDMFAGSGWVPSRSTLMNLQFASADLIRPLARLMADLVRTDNVIATDDTSVTLLLPSQAPAIDTADPKSARVREVILEAIEAKAPHVKAKLWAYRGVTVPLNVFDFTVSRHRDGPDQFLIDANYHGTLLGDCYGANTGIAMRSSGEIVHAACVSHARRHVRDAISNHERHGKALMRWFGQLYAIEDRGRQLDAAARLELRQREAVPVWKSMDEYIRTQTLDLLPKDKMRQALNYLENQWSALTRYLNDPLLPIDNNETEQLMKQVALGRKNWMFVGSVASGYRMADLMTLVSSAIRNDLHVWHYIKGVLDALLSGSTDYESLRPDVWGKSHPEHCRAYRAEERETRQHRKQESRAKRRRLAAASQQ